MTEEELYDLFFDYFEGCECAFDEHLYNRGGHFLLPDRDFIDCREGLILDTRKIADLLYADSKIKEKYSEIHEASDWRVYIFNFFMNTGAYCKLWQELLDRDEIKHRMSATDALLKEAQREKWDSSSEADMLTSKFIQELYPSNNGLVTTAVSKLNHFNSDLDCIKGGGFVIKRLNFDEISGFLPSLSKNQLKTVYKGWNDTPFFIVFSKTEKKKLKKRRSPELDGEEGCIIKPEQFNLALLELTFFKNSKTPITRESIMEKDTCLFNNRGDVYYTVSKNIGFDESGRAYYCRETNKIDKKDYYIVEKKDAKKFTIFSRNFKTYYDKINNYPSVKIAFDCFISAETKDLLEKIKEYAPMFDSLYTIHENEAAEKFSNRIALLLSKNEEDSLKIKEKSKKYYRVRSEIIHGSEKTYSRLKSLKDDAFLEWRNWARQSILFFLLLFDRYGSKENILQTIDKALHSSAIKKEIKEIIKPFKDYCL